ncbi:MAG: FAD-binding protein, partial [Dehalococcoidales bacterium]|nr:FAD-binding protein [Dehalococcoidales bacterium]
CRTGCFVEFGCRFLVLATGGAGHLYKLSTNSDIATGDGVALAFKAGAEIVDMEFFQFHPTALRMPGVTPFLISESVRGEGGVLRNVDGYRFMPDYTPEADLAPRDVVTRSILYEMRKTASDRVFVDVTHLSPNLITTRFPNIYRFCLVRGLDITRGLIPVAPAAHYLMGGVKTNTWGETNIKGLFVIGEASCTGVHGANRLASNSLLEAVVFSQRVIERTTRDTVPEISGTEKDTAVRCSLSKRRVLKDVPPPSLSALQELNWDKVGIIRDKASLNEALDILAAWQNCLPEPTDRPSYELNNLAMTGRLVAEAALLREESRGAHFRTDFPKSSPDWRHHLILVKQ